MPKLAANVAREAEQAAEDDPYKLLPAGLYVGKLDKVEVSDKEGNSGYHYWSWHFKVQDDGYKGSEQRAITSLSPKARFSIGAVFAAFGVPADTHTDELVGQLVMLQVTQQPITSGQRAGQIGNQVQAVLAYDGSLGVEDIDDHQAKAQASDF